MAGVFRILVADDHALVVAAMRILVERIEGVSVIGEAHNGRDAVSLAREHRPDLVIMDISMKDLNGIEATALIKESHPSIRVMMLSSHTGSDYVRRAIRAGADGYLIKGSMPAELRTAIEAIMKGNPYLSPSISGHVMAGIREPAQASALEALSPRQREVLQMIAEGRGTKEIAFALQVSIKTAEVHRAAIMQRLGIRDVAGLALFAARYGLVDLDREGPGAPPE
jgi:DNA-binding NarL/FixJ family response regulator